MRLIMLEFIKTINRIDNKVDQLLNNDATVQYKLNKLLVGLQSLEQENVVINQKLDSILAKLTEKDVASFKVTLTKNTKQNQQKSRRTKNGIS